MTKKELEAQLDKLERQVNSNWCTLRYALACAALLGVRYAEQRVASNAGAGSGGPDYMVSLGMGGGGSGSGTGTGGKP